MSGMKIAFMRNKAKAVRKNMGTGNRTTQMQSIFPMSRIAAMILISLSTFSFSIYNSVSFILSAFSATMRWSMQSCMSPSMKANKL